MEEHNLENLCCYHIQANMMAYVTPEMQKCKDCETYYSLSCNRYKDIRTTQMPLRYGKVAYARNETGRREEHKTNEER